MDRPVITELNPNDVILGKGFRAREYIGTKQFHESVRSHVPAYFSTSAWEEKNIIAYRIINAVSAKDPPGRFVLSFKPDASNKSGADVVYTEVDCNTALKKTKQTLRDYARQIKEKSGGALTLFDEASVTATSTPSNVPGVPNAAPAFTPVFLSSRPPPPVHHSNAGILHELGQLAGRAGGAVQNAFTLGWLDSSTGNAVAPPNTDSLASAVDIDSQNTIEGRDKRTLDQVERTNRYSEEEIIETVGSNLSDSAASAASFADEEAAKQLLALLTTADAPRFTAEDELREKEELTEEEKQAALADMFGNLCQVDQQGKRLKRPGPTPVETLLEEMRREIDVSPAEKKRALLEAIAKAQVREFSNDRLELFLNREDGNATKAARRFVVYWEERRKLFGPDKFCLPMTLDGAFRDDAVALEAGLFQLLPDVDASGRQIMWVQPLMNHGKSKRGYDTMSAARAIWYMYEAALEREDAKQGLVNLFSAKGMSLWDNDPDLDNKIVSLGDHAWPANIRSFHICHLPSLVARYVMPLWLAMTDRRSRARIIVHSVPKEKLIEDLARYGISDDVVPVEVGGQLTWNHSAWLAKRRLAGK